METSISVSGRVVDKILTPTPWTTPAMDSLKLTTQMDQPKKRNTRDLTQQDDWKTQDGRMTKKVSPDIVHSRSSVKFLRHSAVLSLTAVLLRKVSNDLLPSARAAAERH